MGGQEERAMDSEPDAPSGFARKLLGPLLLLGMFPLLLLLMLVLQTVPPMLKSTMLLLLLLLLFSLLFFWHNLRRCDTCANIGQSTKQLGASSRDDAQYQAQKATG